MSFILNQPLQIDSVTDTWTAQIHAIYECRHNATMVTAAKMPRCHGRDFLPSLFNSGGADSSSFPRFGSVGELFPWKNPILHSKSVYQFCCLPTPLLVYGGLWKRLDRAWLRWLLGAAILLWRLNRHICDPNLWGMPFRFLLVIQLIFYQINAFLISRLDCF